MQCKCEKVPFSVTVENIKDLMTFANKLTISNFYSKSLFVYFEKNI